MLLIDPNNGKRTKLLPGDILSFSKSESSLIISRMQGDVYTALRNEMADSVHRVPHQPHIMKAIHVATGLFFKEIGPTLTGNRLMYRAVINPEDPDQQQAMQAGDGIANCTQYEYVMFTRGEEEIDRFDFSYDLRDRLVEALQVTTGLILAESNGKRVPGFTLFLAVHELRDAYNTASKLKSPDD